jgi:hypothetical protein
MFFIKQYRNGKYGKYTLDDITVDSLNNYFINENHLDKQILSKNQEKKSLWNKKREKRLERWKRRGH